MNEVSTRHARVKRVAVLAWLAMLASGCSNLQPRDAIEQLAAFQTLPSQPQVHYALRARPFADQVAAVLAHAQAQVEFGHYRAFRSPPQVYVCDTDACFQRFVPATYNFTAAVVYSNRLVLAPRLFDREPGRLTPVLIHELSHLHLGQFRGHYTTAIPVWFHEGLASLVADGGGADLADDAEAWQSADRGLYFRPDEQHLPWIRRMPAKYELPVNLFYRQTYIYMRDLRARDGEAFHRLLDLLYAGEEFDTAFARTMYTTPQHSVAAYFRGLSRLGSATVSDDKQ
jgi:hypothetical protein